MPQQMIELGLAVLIQTVGLDTAGEQQAGQERGKPHARAAFGIMTGNMDSGAASAAGRNQSSSGASSTTRPTTTRAGD